jgi:hypothetical protein
MPVEATVTRTWHVECSTSLHIMAVNAGGSRRTPITDQPGAFSAAH